MCLKSIRWYVVSGNTSSRKILTGRSSRASIFTGDPCESSRARLTLYRNRAMVFQTNASQTLRH
ncbi:hypothetical protein V1477_015966 [Vespula maculifrons]|uniref:Uncharacterized protein n=1 Tax=Vespula maculifrons TaxID=7453 RepID=A0ABD2BBW0_VESMC